MVKQAYSREILDDLRLLLRKIEELERLSQRRERCIPVKIVEAK